MALIYTPTNTMGTPCPDFSGKTVDGQFFSKNQLEKNRALLVMFICNHCPYVKAIEDRLIRLGRDLQSLNIHCVAVASNDPAAYPEDSLENLAKRWREKEYGFPYIFDESQKIAKDFGAVCTPDFFGYDRQHNLAYRGRLDDSWKDSSKVNRRELLDAMTAIASGQKIPWEQTPSMGCSIKWK
jgi:thiol-disulfide isomerase/thioredoxin